MKEYVVCIQGEGWEGVCQIICRSDFFFFLYAIGLEMVMKK